MTMMIDDDHDLSDYFSEAEDVIRNRLSQSVVEETAPAQEARLVKFTYYGCLFM